MKKRIDWAGLGVSLLLAGLLIGATKLVDLTFQPVRAASAVPPPQGAYVLKACPTEPDAPPCFQVVTLWSACVFMSNKGQMVVLGRAKDQLCQ